ncbi:MAG TPA: ParB N-terminal domain-containing protein [Candidatus Dormibacteraeota bacterium]|nr:ParB N-terminal domain-containing protein [Candidatus Dormibacteraeota bacterium]
MTKKTRELRIEQADPQKLNPAAYNPRKITPHKMTLLRRSIAKFGFIDAVQVRKAGDQIIGGHQRVKAAILENLKTIPVVRLDISDGEAKLLNLALNAEYGTVDVPKLSFLLKELKIAGAEMELTGYNAAEIDELTSDTAAVFEELDLRPPPTVVWVLLGIPFEQFGKAHDALAALQELSSVSVQSNRD